MSANQPKTVAVIGGGVAGIAAAVALADNGFEVQIFEKRSLLGGRASSWIEHETGERLDACQHGTMRCCTNLSALLERLEVNHLIRYHDSIHFLDSQGKRSVIKGCGLPAPAHTAISFLCHKSLGLMDKAGIARAMIAILRAHESEEWDTLDIGSWFERMGQTERAVKRFWLPILISACNDSLDRIACRYAFKVFREGFLGSADGFHFGVPAVPLGTLYTEPTANYLKSRGGAVRTKCIVDRMETDGDKITGIVLQNGERLTPEYYVAGLQSDLLLKLVPAELSSGLAYFENIRKIELSPLIGVHLWFDRAIDCPDALALLDRTSDWIFNKNKNFNMMANSPTYLSVVISARPELAGWSKEKLLETVLAEVYVALPETRDAKLLKSYVLKERKGTFAPVPGVEAFRPDQRSPVPNLFVAGEWTRTGWPSTMESAARSGFLAAEKILETEGRPKSLLAPDVNFTGLSKFLVRRCAG